MKTIIRKIKSAAGKLYKKIFFSEKYHELTGIVLGVTYRCNAHCSHCSQSDFVDTRYTHKELTIDDIDILFTELKKLGIGHVNLFGGEPLLRKDIVSIVKSGSDHYLKMSLETNAFLLDEEKVALLKEAGLTQAIIGLDYSDPDMHDKFKRLNGCWDRAMNAIRLFKEYGIACHISVTATHDKIRDGEIKNILEYGRTLGISAVRVMLPVQMGRWKQNKSEVLTEDEYEALKSLVKEYDDIALLNCHTRSNIISCGVLLRDSFFINAFGDVMPCCLVPVIFGNIKKEGLSAILKRMWHNKMFKASPQTCWAINPFYTDYIHNNYFKALYNDKNA